MIESVLIANRGEIACRVIRTCRRLGILAIAVYSDADRQARHVREADQAIRIGPAEAVNSYLSVDAIVEAARSSGAQAIHPGYGFLSERPELAGRCVANDLLWIGPRADLIRRMGSKIESKHIAGAAGLPCVPGYDGEDQSAQRLRSEADRIGYPVLIKASAGGGGKGMRRVDSAAEFPSQLSQALQEAQRSFGDVRVLLEKLILRPRHLEVQIAGDRHGKLVHLFERECSIQRNFQKLIEEAPAAFLSDTTRQRLYERALALGKTIGYDSLGTVEFIVEAGSEEPYFLEMNTRLQVEHTVTEQITGLDLVEMQLRIADGEPIHFSEPPRVRGWAIEARINCENPADGYKPQLGTVGHYAEPEAAGIRVDSGIGAGSEISPHYDSMIAKIIGHGPNRKAAARRLAQGLAQFEAEGLGTNQALLLDILDRPHFLERPLSTQFLQDQFAAGWTPAADHTDLAAAALAYACLRPFGQNPEAMENPWQHADGFRIMRGACGQGQAQLSLRLDANEPFELGLAPAEGTWLVVLRGRTLALKLQWLDHRRVLVEDETSARRAFTVSPIDESYWFVSHLGCRWRYSVETRLAALATATGETHAGSAELRAQMPGIITAIQVAPGQRVQAGEVLAVMEAMKLIMPLEASRAGTIEKILCAPGQIVSTAQVLISITP